MAHWIPNIISAVGIFTIGIVVVKAINLITIYTLPSRLSRYAHTSSNGNAPWALVTGASDGIGHALAHELAMRGFNVVIHGRNHTKLSVALSRLQATHPERSFRLLIADASTVPCTNCIVSEQPSSTGNSSQISLDFNAIQADLSDLHLTVLINNAGGGAVNPICLPLSESSAARITGNVSLNALFPLHLTRVLLPILRRNSPALVMNISSMADKEFPLLASYSASKQFLMNMTRAVGLELRLDDGDKQVEILGIRIGRVTDVSHCKEPPSLFTPDSQTIARAALAQSGRGNGIVVGYWAHALQQLGSSLLPAWAQDQVIMAVMRKEREREQGTK
ncbi:short chain dehydrogenase [Colletotrichum chrysophilum]|uniref:Short chain dehydrogenase n=1 Tax=Colletotrichum chrysophilum TaxID=1836956 RepID=A0AAD9AVZ0_9PEZI|nr:short chain dehydrogenase [Colletotrichum chrysophilum]